MQSPHRARLALLPLLLALLAGCGGFGTASTSAQLPPPAPTTTTAPLPPIRLPQDEAPHRTLTEWWYYTGHLRGQDASGRERVYGFELTFFQTLRGQLQPYYAAHFGITDLTAGRFRYDQRAGFLPLASLPSPNSTAGFTLALGGWTLRGLNGTDVLNASQPGYAISLTLRDQLPRVVEHGGNGLITYGLAGYSYYYSRPLMSVSGTLTDSGTPISVTGEAWMDHQWGNFLSFTGSGWDWFSIQLADRTEYMLYVIRDVEKRPVSVVGTAIAADGTARELTADQITITATGRWTSPVTGGVYPSGWEVRLPGTVLRLTPALQDQELVTAQSTGVAYWEGAVQVTRETGGRAIQGQGYVELTGYANLPAGVPGGVLP